MGLDSLLNSLESVTPVTSCNAAGVALKPLPNKTVTPVTRATPRKTKSVNNPEITAEQETLIREWLGHIEEPKKDHHIVIEKCRRDREALDYFLSLIKQTKEGKYGHQEESQSTYKIRSTYA